MAAARLGELAYSRRNIAGSGPATEGTWSRRTYPAVVAIHAATIGGTIILGRGRGNRLWLALLLLAQPVRAWVLLSLGRSWNTRAAVPERMDVVTGGPYRFVRHPNYSVVGIELFALPAAFGAYRLAFLATAANTAALALRIPEEERALFRLPGYRAHFERLPRFIPRLF